MYWQRHRAVRLLAALALLGCDSEHDDVQPVAEALPGLSACILVDGGAVCSVEPVDLGIVLPGDGVTILGRISNIGPVPIQLALVGTDGDHASTRLVSSDGVEVAVPTLLDPSEALTLEISVLPGQPPGPLGVVRVSVEAEQEGRALTQRLFVVGHVAACDKALGSCDGNWANGCETDLWNSTLHCGLCGAGCPAPAKCVEGVCELAACEPGFAGPGCSDVDECEASTHTCDAHAECTNTRGGFVCACVPGYEGDGVNCFGATGAACIDTAACVPGHSCAEAVCVGNPGVACTDHAQCLGFCLAGFCGPPPLPDTPHQWDDDPCASTPEATGYEYVLSQWAAQDAINPPPAGAVLFVGSSSIRRWERLYEDFSGWPIIQRGFGGALISHVATQAEALILPHNPSAVVVFAGTNDIAADRPPEAVVNDFRCLTETIWANQNVPVLYIGITPTPLRWNQWGQSSEVNAQIVALAGSIDAIHYIDVPSAFLQTGEPPTDALFVEDGLHLNAAGYALFSAVIHQALAAVVPPQREYQANPLHPPSGARVLVDIGPDNPDDGLATPSPVAGLHWNNWHNLEGEAPVVAGQTLGNLVTTAGDASGIGIVITGGFLGNGLLNGGLKEPSSALLGDLAVAEATSDYFFVAGPDAPGALSITGLDPAQTYRLALFGTRNSSSETRVTRYTVRGAGATASVTLQTTGNDIGQNGYDGNDAQVAVLEGLSPDAFGQLHLDVLREQGSFAYLGLIDLQVE